MESEHVPARPRFLDLGVLAIEADGTEQRIGGRQLATILGVLLVDADRHVSVDRLLDALWPDGSGSTSTLDSHLFRLRKLLEPARRRGVAPTVLLSEPRGYRLVVSPTQVDSLRFEQLVSDALALHGQGQSARALRRCDEALSLWRGTPYTPVEDQEWAAPAVGRLTERLAQVSELRLSCLLGVGDAGTALAESSRLVTEHPLREGIWAARMLAAYRTGRTDLALQTYSTARATLRDELGLEPGPELRRLQSRILAADPELVGVVRETPTVETRPVEVRLPSVRTAIIGRDGDLGRLESELTTHELVTLVGPAGCGKTRLAIETGRRTASQFPDGVYFVSLVGAGDQGQLLDEVTSGLGVAAAPAGSPTDALREFCAGRRMLLILDNCEHILDEVAELVDSLLAPDTEVTVLATSRVPLDLDGEVISTLQPLPVTDPAAEVDDNGTPVRSTAVQLFLERLRVADPSAATAPDLSVVSRICRDVDGLPLAIELAAARARSFSLEEIAAQTAADPGSLSRVGREHPDHHDSVRHAIEWSYRTLDPVTSDLHRRIALLPGPFTPDLASALAHLDRSATVHRLAELVHCSMLVPLGPRRPGRPSRFTQLATVRAHGLQAQLRDEAVDVRGQKIAWVEDLLDRKPRVGTTAETGWFAEVDDNLAALRATLQDALVDRPHPVGAAITHRLGLFWYYRGMIIEGLRWLQLATQSPAATPFDRWMAHLSMAGQLCMQTRLDLAMPYFEVALDDPPELTDSEVVYAGEIFSVSCQAAWNAGGSSIVTSLSARVRRWADQLDDPALQMFATSTELMDATVRTAPDVLLGRIAEAYAQTVALSNRFAAVSHAALGVGVGLAARRPADAVAWADRMLDHHRQLGLGDTPMLMELKADALSLAGQAYEATVWHAAAEAHSKRAGMRYPMRPVSAELAALAAASLTDTERERARSDGAHRSQQEISSLSLEPV